MIILIGWLFIGMSIEDGEKMGKEKIKVYKKGRDGLCLALLRQDQI